MACLWDKFRLWWRLEDIAHENLVVQLPVIRQRFCGLRNEIEAKEGSDKKRWCAAETRVSDAWPAKVDSLLKAAETKLISAPELSWRLAKIAAREMVTVQASTGRGMSNI